MKVSVIIPVWNLFELTAACLESLAATAAGADIGVVVVDNGSTDDTVSQLEGLGKRLFGQNFCRVRLESNLGFAVACNHGAKAARGELLFFLNNDTTACQGWLPPLLEQMEDRNIGAAGPLLLYPNGTVQHCGIAFSPLNGFEHLYEHFPGDHPLIGKSRRLQAITGAAIMVPASLFQEAGAFNEGYLNGFEDVDLCFGLRQLGYKLALAPKSRIIHHTSQTPGRFDAEKRNSQLLSQRWFEHVVPDLHRHALVDGYEMRIDPNLFCWLTVPQARAKALEQSFAGEAFDIQACLAQLKAEPLWPGGWQLCMDWLEKNGKSEEAIGLGQSALCFFPPRLFQARLLRLLRQHGRMNELAELLAYNERTAPVKQEAGKSSQNNEGGPGRTGSGQQDHAQGTLEHRRGMIQLARRRAREQDDKALQTILDQWLIDNRQINNHASK